MNTSATDLNSKVILVSGAAAGIGLGIARQCCAGGARVILADINKNARERAVELGDSALYIPVDVSSVDDITRLFAEVSERYGRLDGLVNNAGITIEGDFLGFAPETLDRLWQVNQRSVFLMSQQAAIIMRDQGGGSIVNIASNHAGASVPGYEMYAGTKAGIVAMSRAMAWSLGEFGIRVNSVSPGLTHTEAVAEVLEEKPELLESFNAMHADGRYSTVEEIGNLVAFLLSDLATAMTGANLLADHGQSANLVPRDQLV